MNPCALTLFIVSYEVEARAIWEFEMLCRSTPPQSQTVSVVSILMIQQQQQQKKSNISYADKQTSLNNSSEAFANQHTVAPVKTCRLFPLFEWTPAGTFDALLALCAFIQRITRTTSHTCLVCNKCKSNFVCQS